MAATKSNTTLFSAQSLTAGGGNQTSSVGTLTGGYGAELYLRLTNGATGPTVAAQVQIEVSPDNSSWFDFGAALTGLTSNNGVIEWTVEIPIGVQYVRLVAGSNTGGSTVTVDAVCTNVTGV
jgi:hypothetical protein